MKKVKFNKKILIIGCGAVSQCTMPLLLKHLDINPKNITVIDFVDNRETIREALELGVTYVVGKITEKGYAKELSSYVGDGDMIIDLGFNIDACAIIQWCHDNNVLYTNASVEEWNPYQDADKKTPQQRTLYHRHMRLRDMMATWENKKGTTAVLDHGANPGLVSHFTKYALVDIAHKIINEKPHDPRIPELKKYLTEKNFPKIAQLTGTKVIHISERDTQVANQPKKVNEFVNTWSVEGFYEEAIAPAEMGWGTHEKELPEDAYVHERGPKNQICLSQMGMKTKVRSWVPCGEIVGMVVRHGEAFTLSDHLTVWENGKAVYRPTVHYAYCCSDVGILSLHELEMRQFDLQEEKRVIMNEIVCGRDELGVLLMGHDFKSWWTGSLLDIEETRKLVPNQNATTLQVACSVLAAVVWMIKNPDKGVLMPDDLPYDEILEIAKPYLGPFVSIQSDWDPTQNRQDHLLFNNYRARSVKLNEENMWQFSTFLISK